MVIVIAAVVPATSAIILICLVGSTKWIITIVVVVGITKSIGRMSTTPITTCITTSANDIQPIATSRSLPWWHVHVVRHG
jgi:hypothetical protein